MFTSHSDLEYQYRFANEKTGHLKRLFQQKRIDDMERWRHEIRINAQAIENLAAIQNHLAKEKQKSDGVFRVEMNDPIDCYRSPLIFRASVYVNDTYSQKINCIVTDDELARLPISNRSLSKTQTRRRRIDDYYQSFRTSFAHTIDGLLAHQRVFQKRIRILKILLSSSNKMLRGII